MREDKRRRLEESGRGDDSLDIRDAVVVRDHAARVVWDERVVLDEPFFLFLRCYLAFGAPRVEHPSGERLDLTPVICNCGERSLGYGWSASSDNRGTKSGLAHAPTRSFVAIPNFVDVVAIAVTALGKTYACSYTETSAFLWLWQLLVVNT